MSQTPPPNRLAAMKEDGFIDFYELLGVEPDATITRLRTTINALYNEAQSNRDHRNLNRRREYQTLLQLLPQARELLLEEKNRERYDAFRADVQRGVASTSFEDWSRNLKEEEETSTAGRSAVLGVQPAEGADLEPPRASVTKVTTPKPAKKATSRVTVGEDAPAAPVPASRASLMGSVIAAVVFFILFGVLRFAANLDYPLSIIIAAVAAIVVFFVTHRKATSRTAV